MKTKQFIFFIIFIVSIIGCDNKTEITEDVISGNEEESIKKIKENTDINLLGVSGQKLAIKKNGEKFQFGINNNKIVLLDFFATWCPPCRAEIPHLINLQNKYKDNFQILAILLEEDKKDSEVQKFINEFKINYEIFNSAENEKLVKAVGGVKSIPLMILYDKEGKYFTHYIGAVPEEMIEADIKRIMENQ